MTPVAWRDGARRVGRRVAATTLALALPIASVGVPPARAAADPVTPVIERFRAEIPQLMADQGVPGLAVAVVDGETPLWVEGFGHVDGPDSAPVTADTIFSVQSMSKVFTATAVMRAVQDGLVALDEPITTYLPDFTVHSAFEAQPERKITLRMLLGHTAGFTHEAPIGNNNDLEPGDFDEHVAQHLGHLAAVPRRHRLRLLEPRDRPGGLHPRAGAREAVRGAHATSRCSRRWA